MEQIYVLLIGCPAQLKQMCNEASSGNLKILEQEVSPETLSTPLDPTPHILVGFVGEAEFARTGISALELGQSLRMNYPAASLFIFTDDRKAFDRKNLQKNGVDDAFFWPQEVSVFFSLFKETITKISQGKIKSYRSVKLVDLEPGASLSFETALYLPANKKYVTLSLPGQELDQDRVEKLKKHNLGNLQIPTDQMSEFYKYSAVRLKKMGSASAMSATERREQLESAVRDLMGGLFLDQVSSTSFADGQKILKDCREIVSAYVTDGDKGNWYDRLLSTLGESSGSYSHSSNVSTFSALFSLGIGKGDPTDLALAGLLHDIGLTTLDPAMVSKRKKDRTAEEQAAYERHPEISLNMAKEKKLILSEKVQKAILQHHERFDGKGFPKGFSGSRICIEAQILALADVFDDLTTAQDGRPRLTPREAMEKIKSGDLASIDEQGMPFDPVLVEEFLKLLPSKE